MSLGSNISKWVIHNTLNELYRLDNQFTYIIWDVLLVPIEYYAHIWRLWWFWASETLILTVLGALLCPLDTKCQKCVICNTWNGLYKFDNQLYLLYMEVFGVQIEYYAHIWWLWWFLSSETLILTILGHFHTLRI